MADQTTYPRAGDRTPSARAQREEYWRRVLARQKQSGLSKGAFCRREEINGNAFTWWTRELRKRDQPRQPARGMTSEPKHAQRHAFVPVHVIQTSRGNGASALEVVTRDGHVVRVQSDFDPVMLRKVVAALESKPC